MAHDRDDHLTSYLYLVQNVSGHFRDVYAGEFRSGFERALALQALLCATGPSDTVPEARARCLVESVLSFLNASSVRWAMVISVGLSGMQGSSERRNSRGPDPAGYTY